MRYTEDQLRRMASPIGKNEDERCKHAICMVRDALETMDYIANGNVIKTYLEESYSYTLDLRKIMSNRKITLLVQGSYANKTNIPSESDVDVAVILESTFFPEFRPGVGNAQYGFTEGTFSVYELKNEVETALKKKFGLEGVERHNKCIKVTGNTYRVDADVVPAYRYKDYTQDIYNDVNNYTSGIKIVSDDNECIINYPEQHIENGIIKNKNTGYSFKKCVRIIKSIREDMIKNGCRVSSNISSFGLESLLWNIDDSIYKRFSNLEFILEEIVSYLKRETSKFESYMEINGIKELFDSDSIKNEYIDFINDLHDFIEL